MINKNKLIFIIAEAGVNHNGDLNIAKKMIDAAKDTGVDAIKFQTFKAENIVTRNAKKADYQLKSTSSIESQFSMIKKLELDKKAHLELLNYCNKKKIIFLSTPFDLDSISLLNEISLSILKIPSGEITNLPYLRKIGALKKKIIISTGMAYLSEIKKALDVLISSGTKKKDITVLHCNTEYPTLFKDVNLKAMLTIKDKLSVNVGYSDHTLGIEVPIAAVALGAKVIEKHFTLDRNMEGPDHKASLEPDELKKMVQSIRNIESALGSGIKKPSSSEMKNINIARKSIVALRDIKKGEKLTSDNITTKRPGNGISPMLWDQVIDKKAIKDFKKDQFIEI